MQVDEIHEDRNSALLQGGGFALVIAAGFFLTATSVTLPVLCPLRLVTGVPCPLCGMTTGTVGILRGDLAGAVAANPFSLGVVPAALAGIWDSIRRLTGKPSIARFAPRGRTLLILGLTVSAVSWVFQLKRFGLI